jgi:ketosteroid isomerase-like protein
LAVSEISGADPIETGLRAWAAGDLDALEAVLAPDITLSAVEPGPWDCVGREQVMALLRRRRTQPPAYPVHVHRVDERTWTVTSDAPIDPEDPEPFRHGTRITVTGGLVTTMQQYRADTAPV